MKVLGEKLGFGYMYEHRLPFTVVRFRLVFAPDEPTMNILAFPKGTMRRWMIEGADGDTLIIRTNREGRPWKIMPQDIVDTVNGTILALEKDASTGEAFNIHGPSPARLDEAVKYASRVTGLPFVERSLNLDLHYEVSISKAKSLLGYKPKYDVYAQINRKSPIAKGRKLSSSNRRPVVDISPSQI